MVENDFKLNGYDLVHALGHGLGLNIHEHPIIGSKNDNNLREKMIITDESWYIVRNTKGVTGFVGPGSKPVPLSDAEVEAMGIDLTVFKVSGPEDLEVGEVVTITAGPFVGQTGTVKHIDTHNDTARICIDAFGGKETPLEVSLKNIERI